MLRLPTATCLVLFAAAPCQAEVPTNTRHGDQMIAEYFRLETAKLSDACLSDVSQWKSQRETYRQQLLEMLGLDPLPERTDLKTTITGRVEHETFVVEKLHFQSRPGLYVTANLYRPKVVEGPLPAILYVCGHGRVQKDGVSYGNKVHYQHHPSWFARNGYVCLAIDTLQLGEIEGIHHGTYRYNMWWWLCRNYTPAGVEAWNCVRALDYLQSRPEVDGERIGVTGRSGGGAYSWWIAAIDDRIKVAVPVAGITDLENHVVDGCVEGHCDCMFMVNTYRWDYPLLAALVAPRPLLISNTDRDSIFPLEGVVRTHRKVREVYKWYGAEDKLALHITAGPHNDTQELRVHAFRWFDLHLKGEDRPVTMTAEKFFQPEQLKVFGENELPADEINTRISETFTEQAPAAEVPKEKGEWETTRNGWRRALGEKSFRGWPETAQALNLAEAFSAEHQGIRLQAFDFDSQGPIRLRLYVAQRADLDRPKLVVLNVLDERSWSEFLATMRPAFEAELAGQTLPEANAEAFKVHQQMFQSQDWAMAYVAPRGIGPTSWNGSDRKRTHILRRFYLLGQTLDGMQVWDTRRAIQAVRQTERLADVPLWLQSQRVMAGVTLYASLFESDIARLDLHNLPASHHNGPYLLNVRRIFDTPQAVAMACERSQVVLYDEPSQTWPYPRDVIDQLGWPDKQLQLRPPVTANQAGAN